jgi:ADP-heptose:LPS heptosyltransferase
VQKEIRQSDLVALKKYNISHFEDAIEDFSDTAALCDLMDFVISVDTSVAHLAGALGKRVNLILPEVPDWRWLLKRHDSPWYPSMTIFRKNRDTKSWEGLLSR